MPCEEIVNINDISDLDLDPELYNVVVGTTINLSSSFTLPSGEQLTLIAGNEINQENSNIYPGSNYQAVIDNSICQSKKKGNKSKVIASERTNQSIMYMDSVKNYSPLKIYPNPNDGEFIIEFSSKRENFSIYIADINGKVIFNKADTKQSEVKINLSNQENGSYNLYIINSNKDKVYTHKIIKSK